MNDHRSYICTQGKMRPLLMYTFAKKILKKSWGFNGIQIHDPWNTGLVLYQLSYQPIWERSESSCYCTPLEDK